MNDRNLELRITISREMKNVLKYYARNHGISMSEEIRNILRDYVQQYWYSRAHALYNFEDRIGTNILISIEPLLDEINMKLSKILTALNEISYPERLDTKEKDYENTQSFPEIPGLDYTIQGDEIIYEDGSVYNTRTGEWTEIKDKVDKWKKGFYWPMR